MTYPPPPPGSPPPPPGGGQPPYGGPQGWTPPPQGWTPPSQGWTPPPPGGYQPPGPPPRPSRRLGTGAILAIAAIIVVAVAAAGVGVFLVTRDGDGIDRPSIDGETSVAAATDGESSELHDVEVPADTSVVITIDPDGDWDPDARVAELNETYQEGGAGDDEVIEYTAPDDEPGEFSLEVYGYEGASGDYEISITEE